MKNGWKMTDNLRILLFEALRRWIIWGDNKSLTEAWTGLGCKTTYKSALNAGLMEWVYGPPKTGTMGWLKLTPKGVDVLRGMLHTKLIRNFELNFPKEY